MTHRTRTIGHNAEDEVEILEAAAADEDEEKEEEEHEALALRRSTCSRHFLPV